MLIGIIAFGGSAATLALAVAIFVALTRGTKDREGFWPEVLGPLTRLAVSGAIAGFVAATIAVAWLHTGEHHTVMAVRTEATTDDDAASCRFTWPTRTAAHEQTSPCPTLGSSGVSTVYPSPVTAARVPGTDVVYLPDAGLDPFSVLALFVAVPCAIATAVGVGFNARPSKRWRTRQQRRLLASWQAGGPRPGPDPIRPPTPGLTRDDLSWSQIAAASERPDVHGGPLEQAPFFSRAPGTGPSSPPEGYPLPYVRLMTRPASAPHRSVLLLFAVDGGAWWVEADGQPAREGTAVIERTPGAPHDLRARVDDYTVDLGDAPVFLPRPRLDEMRSMASRWVTTPAPSPGATPSAPTATPEEDRR